MTLRVVSVLLGNHIYLAKNQVELLKTVQLGYAVVGDLDPQILVPLTAVGEAVVAVSEDSVDHKISSV